jgi:1-acyl-sn-glycerol-3-phosphate acyltransferase
MGILRALWRLAGIGLVTSWWYGLWLASRAVRIVSPGLARSAHHRIVTCWARGVLCVLGVRVTVAGTPPEPPFFLVSNHLSYVDVTVLLSCVDGFFLAKSDVAGWPILGLLARTTGTLFVERGRKSDLVRVNREVERVLERGAGVIVFPEGTSSRGAEVLPFRPPLFEVPVKLGFPVANASLTYATAPPATPAELSVCWWGDMVFLPHFLALLTLPSIRAGLTFGAEINAGEDRKDLARRSHAAVARLFVPVAASEAGGAHRADHVAEAGGPVDQGCSRASTA